MKGKHSLDREGLWDIDGNECWSKWCDGYFSFQGSILCSESANSKNSGNIHRLT